MNKIVLLFCLPLAHLATATEPSHRVKAPLPASSTQDAVSAGASWAELEALFGKSASAPEVRYFIKKHDLHPAKGQSWIFCRSGFPPYQLPGPFYFESSGRIHCVVAVIADPKGKSTTYTGDLPHGMERGDTREDVLRRLGPPDCKGGPDWLCYGKLKLRIIFSRGDGRLKVIMITESLFGPSIYVHRMDPSGQDVYSDVILISDKTGDTERYRGKLPHGLKPQDDVDAVAQRLGAPGQIVDDGGLHTLLYFQLRLRLDFDSKSRQLQVISTLAASGSALRVRLAARSE